MKHLILLLIVSAITFISCSSEKEYPVKITEENGIKTISNPDYPKEGVYDLVLDELFTLGKDEDNSKYIFAQNLSIDLDSKLNLYVHDADGFKFYVFDKAGNYLRQFGRQGQGPGDFGQLIFFKISRDNRIIFNDVFNRKICQLDLNGNYLSSLLYKSPYLQLTLDSKDNIYCIEGSGTPPVLSDQFQFSTHTHNIRKLLYSENEWKSIGSFTGEKYLMKKIENGIMVDGPYNEFEWLLSPDDKLITGFADTYEFCVYDLEGNIINKFNRKFSPFVNPDYKEGKDDPRYLPALSKYNLFDNSGNFWSNLDNGKYPEYYIYDVFTKEGVFIKQVYSKYRITQFKEDRAYSVVNSKNDPVLIKAFKYSLKKREK